MFPTARSKTQNQNNIQKSFHRPESSQKPGQQMRYVTDGALFHFPEARRIDLAGR
jgi:hypothetical protein